MRQYCVVMRNAATPVGAPCVDCIRGRDHGARLSRSRRWCRSSPPVCVYLLAVLLVSSRCGACGSGCATAVLSALAFNFFHIPPTGRFTIAEGENWVALAVFFVAAAGREQRSPAPHAAAREEAERAPARGRPDRGDGAAAARRQRASTSRSRRRRSGIAGRVRPARRWRSSCGWVDSDQRRRALAADRGRAAGSARCWCRSSTDPRSLRRAPGPRGPGAGDAGRPRRGARDELESPGDRDEGAAAQRTWSRPRSCARSRTTCARRSPRSRPPRAASARRRSSDERARTSWPP